MTDKKTETKAKETTTIDDKHDKLQNIMDSVELELSAKPDTMQEIQGIVSKYGLFGKVGDERVKKTFEMAAAMVRLESLITKEMTKDIMHLKNTSLGFKTDERKADPQYNKKEIFYDENIVKRCVIEAMMRGLYPVGNEFNIIAGNMYIAKAGFARLLKEYPGFTNFKPKKGVPRLVGEGAIVTMSATWELDGVHDALEVDIPIKVNKAMGIDAIIGKAMRKLLHGVYEQITGSENMVPEGGADDIIEEIKEEPVQPTHTTLKISTVKDPDDIMGELVKQYGAEVVQKALSAQQGSWNDANQREREYMINRVKDALEGEGGE